MRASPATELNYPDDVLNVHPTRSQKKFQHIMTESLGELSTAGLAPESTQSALPNPFEAPQKLSDFNEAHPLIESISEAIAKGEPAKEPNFPSFFPVVYHNLNEIPKRYTGVLSLCLFGCKSFFWVLLTTVFAQIFSNRINSVLIFRWREMILSVFMLIICPLALLYAQYYPLYVSIRDEKMKHSLVPFQFFTIFVMVFMGLGLPGSGMIGLWYTIITFHEGAGVNQLFSTLITLWHLANVVIQIIIVVLISPFMSAPRRVANPVDLASQ